MLRVVGCVVWCKGVEGGGIGGGRCGGVRVLRVVELVGGGLVV